MSSPVERSMARLRAMGYEVERVERNAPRTKYRPHPIRMDLFGLADLEAWGADHTLYVQVCRLDDFREHIAKALSIELRRLKGDHRPVRRALEALTACPARVFEIWAWGKTGRWREKRWRAVDASSFAIVAPESPESALGAR